MNAIFGWPTDWFPEEVIAIYLSMKRDLDAAMAEKLRQSALTFTSDFTFPHLKMRESTVIARMEGKRYNVERAAPSQDGQMLAGKNKDGTCEFCSGKLHIRYFRFSIPDPTEEQIGRVNGIIGNLLKDEEGQEEILEFLKSPNRILVKKLPHLLLIRADIRGTWVTTAMARKPKVEVLASTNR